MQISKILTSLAILALSAKSGLAAPVPKKAFQVDPHCVEWSHRKQYCYKYEDGWGVNGKIEPVPDDPSDDDDIVRAMLALTKKKHEEDNDDDN